MSPLILASGPPQVSLGAFANAFAIAKPLLIVGFVVFGFYIAATMIFGFLGRLGSAAGDDKPAPTIGDLLTRLLGVAAAVLLAVVVLEYGLDVLNFALKFVWSVTSQVEV